ncbi:hypothetical protein [Cryobacterium ruanii]|uniref:MmyB-like transcription regulator ligand binding domain-containing protein n=1 Tax=Cryobacterium ruanii TaxID=1259197 RepID=A0A4R9ARV3_9MICO|nr:hypothetical protein [Cryobacterium ruanii]TFD68517.1 hypothetical protein E3T47_03460 [Cryobacterium ruanii]
MADRDHWPTVIMRRRNEFLAWNPLGHLLVAGHTDLDAPGRPFDRPTLAVAFLRFIATQHQNDAELTHLIGELTLKSPDFAAIWTKHLVQQCVSGVKRFHHPEVGDFDLSFEVLHLPGGSGQRMMTYIADPGPTDAAALELLVASTAPIHAPRVRRRPDARSARVAPCPSWHWWRKAHRQRKPFLGNSSI